MKSISIKDIKINKKDDNYIFSKNIVVIMDNWGNKKIIQVEYILSKSDLNFILKELK